MWKVAAVLLLMPSFASASIGQSIDDLRAEIDAMLDHQESIVDELQIAHMNVQASHRELARLRSELLVVQDTAKDLVAKLEHMRRVSVKSYGIRPTM